MIHWLADGATTFVLLGISKVIIEPLAMAIIRYPLEKLMIRVEPFKERIYNSFDVLVPELLENGDDPVSRMAGMIELIAGLEEHDATIVADALLKPQRKDGYSLVENAKKLKELTEVGFELYNDELNRN